MRRLRDFAELEKEGLLFNRGENLKAIVSVETDRRKLLVAIPGINVDSYFDIETLYAGTNMALSYMFEHLTKYVDLHFVGKRNRKLADNVYEVDISVADLGRLSRKINETYFGILTLHLDEETWLLPLYEHARAPADPGSVSCSAWAWRRGDKLDFSAIMQQCETLTLLRHPRIMSVISIRITSGTRVSLTRSLTV